MSKRMANAIGHGGTKFYVDQLGEPIPYGGGIPFSGYNVEHYNTRYFSRALDQTSLAGFFKLLRENDQLRDRFTPENVGPILHYFEENAARLGEEGLKNVCSGLDYKKPVLVEGWVRGDKAITIPGINHAFEILAPCTKEQENIFWNKFMHSLALGHCANTPRSKVRLNAYPTHDPNERNVIAPILVVPLLWAMELCSRSFSPENKPADGNLYPLNQHEELPMMDFSWGETIFDKVFGMDQKTNQMAARVGMFAFGSLFLRLGFKDHLNDRKFWASYPEKLRRVGMYASVAKELFMLKEKHLATEYLDSDKMIFYHAYSQELHSIMKYPEFFQTIANPTAAEKELAKKIDEIKNWLLWLEKDTKQYEGMDDCLNKVTMELTSQVHNALSFETDYDSRFIIPAEGGNPFVSKILNDMHSKIKRYFPRGKVIEERGWFGGIKVTFEGYRHLTDKEKTVSR